MPKNIISPEKYQQNKELLIQDLRISIAILKIQSALIAAREFDRKNQVQQNSQRPRL